MAKRLSLASALRQQRQIPWERFIARGGHPVLVLDTIRRCNRSQLRPILGLPNLQYWKRYGEASFFHRRELAAVHRTIRGWLTRRPDLVIQRVDALQRILDRAIRWGEGQRHVPFHTWTLQELQRHFLKFVKHCDRVWASAYFPMFADQVVKDWLTARGVDADTIVRYSAPHGLTELQRKQQVLVTLRRRYGIRLPAKVATDFIERYGWSNSYLFHFRRYTPAVLRREMSEARTSTPSRHKILPASLRRHRKLFYVAQRLVAFRDTRLLAVTKFFYAQQPFMSELARRYGLAFNEIIQLTADEILQQRISRAVIRRRQRGMGYVVLGGQGYLFTGHWLRAMAKEGGGQREKLLRGWAAYPGNVRGRVRKVNPYTYDRIRRGDIIVTGMTTPEIVPFLRKVKAIVTDEGGITAHVAIVAREYKIPCVMGTKIATQVLKDGDRVEVDAEKGIVRRLSR
ncbi:MAG: PEP-utilizing enzyme [bacterium]|nr:PEP-utilizing enzyme [bacterium]